MRVHVSQDPSLDAATHMRSLISNQHIHTLVILSGGSSLNVLEHIQKDVLGPHLTFLMGDERCSKDPRVNNFLQFKKTAFFSAAHELGARIVSSEPTSDKTNTACEEIQTSLEQAFHSFIDMHEQYERNVVALLGMGSDGHIASIFPMEDEDTFSKLYYAKDQLFTSVHVPGNQFEHRVSITLATLERYVNDITFYAVGKEKHDVISRVITFRDDAPAHVLPAAAVTQLPQVSFYTDSSINRTVHVDS